MSEQSTSSHVYELFRNTYFLPLVAAWPLALGLSSIYRGITAKDYIATTTVGPARKCRFPLDLDHSAVLNLPDGRKLGYAQYGAQDGRPVFYHHGFPGSRLEGASWDDFGKKHNARIISIDRPGIGWSTPQPGRKMVDHAGDVEALADHLELKEYAVIGASGGGPYALADAATHPAEKLKGVALFAGLGRPAMDSTGMKWNSRIAGYLPQFLIPVFASIMFRGDIATKLHLDDDYRLGILREQVSKMKKQDCELECYVDAERNDDGLRLALKSLRQAFGQGFGGIAHDGQVLASREDGFRVQDIRHSLPIQLWYGARDVNCPPIHGEQYAAQLGPNAKLRIEPETHHSIQWKYQEEVLETLLQCF